ncbi:uncharacterized protein PFL1_00469 [Pseudozyma flocculosa PF-1]|uniref:Related to catalase n=1 Tax=Pseudozyma flocculosa TaxID=84751 RepID=A0A5C3EQZ6_9BASI|nr:uncharacterized protein PFL1_00469 [Pseudozyma flocculosa PF-1]EPQ32272.1 hypothetical protein PFL1_00469 [Pseudozyma flocculosa PF-1]SPO34774.1 related to catalase [Pseudozyma flocculosa]
MKLSASFASLAAMLAVAATAVTAFPEYAKRAAPGGDSDFFQGGRLKESQAFNNASQMPFYTTENGAPYFQPHGAQRAGPNGPLLLQDTHLLDTLAHFVRERIPERIVHARASGAHGVFEVTTDAASKYSMADVFKKGTKSSVTMRISTVGGGRGSADTARDPRGVAIKIRTKSGILDWVFNNTPVFFIRDPLKFPTFIHTQKTDPATNTRRWDDFFAWPGQFPESLLQFLRLFSDLGTPKGVRGMDAWSGHTYRLVQSDGSWVYAKVKLTSNQGIHNFTAAEAAAVAGQNDAWATQDLYDAIENGNYPSWTVGIAVKTAEEAAKYRYDVLDLTKDWPDAKYEEVGKITLNQNPQNYFAEIEQAHFSPSNMVEGWAASADPVLQSRLFSYNDAGRHRLGPNYLDIPVNCPLSSVANFDRDGVSSVHGNQGHRPNYPSILDKLKVLDRPKTVIEDKLEGSTVHYESKINPDIDYEQPRQFYEQQLTQSDRDNLHSNFAGAMANVKASIIIDNLMAQFQKISPKLAAGVQAELQKAKAKGSAVPTPGANFQDSTADDSYTKAAAQPATKDASTKDASTEDASAKDASTWHASTKDAEPAHAQTNGSAGKTEQGSTANQPTEQAQPGSKVGLSAVRPGSNDQGAKEQQPAGAAPAKRQLKKRVLYQRR